MTTTAGNRLRATGQAQATNAADPRIVLTIDALIAEFNRGPIGWSANDIRDRLPVSSQALVGARVDAARKRGEMEWVGMEPSTLTSTRGHRISIWRGKAAS